MDLPDDVATMPPEHREHFERMRRLVNRLTEELQQAHDGAAAAKLAAADEVAALRRRFSDVADAATVAYLKEEQQRAAARKSAAEVMLLLRALRDLWRAVKTRNGPHITAAEVREIIRAHKAAGEVLKLLDIPF